MTQKEIEAVISQYVETKFQSGRNSSEALKPDTQLFARGIVDSIGILSLVRFLEERFQIPIAPSELLLDNFATIQAMSEFVAAKKGG